MSQKTAAIVGVGPPRGVGAAICRRFAKEGYRIVFLGRNAEKVEKTRTDLAGFGGEVEGVVGDVSQEAAVAELIARADTPQAPLEAAIFNAGGNWPKPFLEVDQAMLEEMWRTGPLGGFFFAQQAIRAMLPRKRGSLIFTGASASMRGKTNFASFAHAKAALRVIAQSAAREFGPQGIHVAHVVIDGVVNGDRVNELFPQFKQQRGEEGMLSPDAIAENYWTLHMQPPTAWTHEIDLRPFNEPW